MDIVKSPVHQQSEILVGFGFNCYRFTPIVDGQPVDVLWSAPGFEKGTERRSNAAQVCGDFAVSSAASNSWPSITIFMNLVLQLAGASGNANRAGGFGRNFGVEP